MNSKTLMLIVGVAVISTSITLFSFTPFFQKEEVKVIATDVTYTLTDTNENFSLDVTWNERGEQEPLTSSETSDVIEYFKNIYSNSSFQTISDIDFLLYLNDSTNTETVTIIGEGVSSGTDNIPVAVEFDSDEPQFILGGTISVSKTHQCVGAPCKCCGFIYETYTYGGWFNTHTGYRVVGCKCKSTPEECITPNGTCNHILSTAPGGGG